MPSKHSRRVRSWPLFIALATLAGCRMSDERGAEPADTDVGEGLVEHRADRVDRADVGDPAPTIAPGASREPLVIDVPASVTPLEFAWIPGGEFERGGSRVRVDGFWMSRTEVPWEVYDVFVHRLDLPDADSDAEAETRPSKPYISMDRGFGHKGYPAISLSAKGGAAFCEWLSGLTGRRFRLPTVDEWEHACLGGGTLRFPPAIEVLDEYAWHRGNAAFTTHPVATRKPNGYGLHDMLGNAAEWAIAPEGPVVCGGSYRDPRAVLAAGRREVPDPSWNASDPQIPKSSWWLADAGFVGLRVVCEEEPSVR